MKRARAPALVKPRASANADQFATVADADKRSPNNRRSSDPVTNAVLRSVLHASRPAPIEYRSPAVSQSLTVRPPCVRDSRTIAAPGAPASSEYDCDSQLASTRHTPGRRPKCGVAKPKAA